MKISSLPELFSDIFGPNDDSFKERRNLTFVYHDEAKVSILLSKDETKIKLQASSFDKQWLLLKELFSRLETHFGREIDEIVAMDSPLPLNEMFELIEGHQALRKAEIKLRKSLEQRTLQFRMI